MVEAELAGGDERLCITDVASHDFGWVFSYQSEAYVRTGDPRHAIPGNAPLLVTREGVVHTTGTAEPIERYVERFVRQASCT